jgi:ATP-dependent DNA helicase RecG
MHRIPDIRRLLDELDERPAEDLESQDLEFKEWSRRGMAEAVASVIEMAICMANGGGGTVVFGVQEKVVGRAKAIVGVPVEVDVNRLVKAVYDSSDPKLTPIFEDLRVPEGTGRLLVMHVYSGLPPYTDTAGKGKIRIGKDCQPLTGTLRRRIMVETGETDYTSTEVPGPHKAHLSVAAMERLRDAARHERAPEELLRKRDVELLKTLGAIRGDKFTRAGLLLAGKETAIREHLPAFVWTHLRMQSDTRYTDRMDGWDPLPVSLARLLDRIMADNPISTLEHGMFHFEYRAYPEIALREALLNALSHADFRLGGPILVKQFPGKLEISNPGGFIGGISPENILHHPPAPRNPRLVEALARLRLVNRSNLGIGRMFEAMLIEGKEPPLIQQQGDSVTVTFLRREPSAPFRAFVAEESRQGRLLSVDHLLILQHLMRHPEIDTAVAARICQRPETEAREVLNDIEQALGYLERGGSGRGTYWTLRSDIHRQLSGPGHPERGRRIDWEAAKTRILSVLRRRAERGEPGLSNAEIRQITYLTRYQVVRLMRELMEETSAVRLSGARRYARYSFASDH